MRTDWHEDLIKDLLRLAGNIKLSAGDIAWQFNQIHNTKLTRNGVIGKLHRLKFKRPSNNKPEPAKKPIPRVALIIKKDPTVIESGNSDNVIKITQPFPYVKNREGCEINELSIHTCHWPLGTMRGRPPYRYCGKPTIEVTNQFGSCQSPWCLEHHKLSRRPTTYGKQAQ